MIGAILARRGTRSDRDRGRLVPRRRIEPAVTAAAPCSSPRRTNTTARSTRSRPSRRHHERRPRAPRHLPRPRRPEGRVRALRGLGPGGRRRRRRHRERVRSPRSSPASGAACVPFATRGRRARPARATSRSAPAARVSRSSLDGRPAGAVALAVPGAHNVRNALAAIAATRELGVAARARGGARSRASRHGAAVRGAGRARRRPLDRRLRAPSDRDRGDARRGAGAPSASAASWSLFQPHLYSRTRDFATRLRAALLGADVVLVAPIYPAREQPIPGVTSDLIAAAGRAAGHGTSARSRSDDGGRSGAPLRAPARRRAAHDGRRRRGEVYDEGHEAELPRDDRRPGGRVHRRGMRRTEPGRAGRRQPSSHRRRVVPRALCVSCRCPTVATDIGPRCFRMAASSCLAATTAKQKEQTAGRAGAGSSTRGSRPGRVQAI